MIGDSEAFFTETFVSGIGDQKSVRDGGDSEDDNDEDVIGTNHMDPTILESEQSQVLDTCVENEVRDRVQDIGVRSIEK
ncbi:hypothetical protein GN958_ATG12678 [Phytophthora infestans]|nr:hypothetical protein GN958_ATG12678 [Phytophthora infestans]